MGAAYVSARVHSRGGGVLERDHGDARGDSWTRSEHAEPCGQECERSGLDAEFARAWLVRGGPCLFGLADQCCGETDASAGNADESFAASARRIEPRTASIANSLD